LVAPPKKYYQTHQYLLNAKWSTQRKHTRRALSYGLKEIGFWSERIIFSMFFDLRIGDLCDILKAKIQPNNRSKMDAVLIT